jgi:hypothetical protein
LDNERFDLSTVTPQKINPCAVIAGHDHGSIPPQKSGLNLSATSSGVKLLKIPGHFPFFRTPDK